MNAEVAPFTETASLDEMSVGAFVNEFDDITGFPVCPTRLRSHLYGTRRAIRALPSQEGLRMTLTTMHRTASRFGTAAVVALVGLAVVGCGGADDQDAEVAPDATARSEPAETAETTASPSTTEPPITSEAPECENGDTEGAQTARKRCIRGEWVADPETPPTTPLVPVDSTVATTNAVAAGVPAEAICDWPATMRASYATAVVTCSIVNPDTSEGVWTLTLHGDLTISTPSYAETKPAPPPPMVFDGVNDFVIDLGTTLTEARYVTFTNDGDSNFIVESLDEGLEQQDLVVNEIGPIAGSSVVNMRDDDRTRYLTVNADGAWHIEIHPLTTAPSWDGATPLLGSGNGVYIYRGTPGLLDFSNDGDSNFIVESYGSNGGDLLINEIGPIQGATTITQGPLLLIVNAEGGWGLTVRPV